MIELETSDYKKITNLIKSQNELSVFSVINNIIPGEIYVNDVVNPTAALIQTCECNLIAGDSNDATFNSEVSSELDFWDQLTPDSDEWIDKIPSIHENPFVRKYKRRHYILTLDKFVECHSILPEGYIIEKVDPSLLREKSFENSEKLLEWIENWGDDENFKKYGTGYLVRNDKTIASWSLSDCSFDKKIAIGITTDERYRKNGFGKMVASATTKDCFTMGYEKIDWLCVDSNKGSIAIAEKLGFKYNNPYYSFTSYAPIENLKDLSEAEWHEWGEYLEEACKTQKPLIHDCLEAYVKSNDTQKVIEIITNMKRNEMPINCFKFNNWINTLKDHQMCSNFSKEAWTNFIKENSN